ncbi:unnamed protein product [Auanema sp. JU1783]|nr:unnamed protein product [Auanema sp. JU1783]
MGKWSKKCVIKNRKSESASGEEMREDPCNELEEISGEESEDESEESEGIEYESEEGSDSIEDSEEDSVKESGEEESNDADADELKMEIDGDSRISEGEYDQSSVAQFNMETVDESDEESEERSEGESEDGSEEELDDEFEDQSKGESEDRPDEESEEEFYEEGNEGSEDESEASGEESDHSCEQNIDVFTKRLEKLSKSRYVSLDEDDEEELYGELKETESHVNGRKYNQNNDQLRKGLARKNSEKMMEIENVKYDEKWDYTHRNMMYEKLKEEDDAFDLKSRSTIMDLFKSRRVYDPANFNARKNFALIPLYDDYGLRSYNPDPREDAPAIQSIINANY